MRVENQGGGLAHDIHVLTAWGDAVLPSLGQGDQAEVTYRVEDGYDPSTRLDVLEFRFKDPAGVEWVQAPSPNYRAKQTAIVAGLGVALGVLVGAVALAVGWL